MSDKEQIENSIDLYYAGCCESDSNKIKEAFDNNAMISGYLPDGLHEMNLDEFSEFVSAAGTYPHAPKSESAVISFCQSAIIFIAFSALKSGPAVHAINSA